MQIFDVDILNSKIALMKQANQQQQIADVLSILPKLGRGLDVNVKFQKVPY